MIVIGGTYQEHVTVPIHDGLGGSGLRAAASLRAVEAPTLVTCLDPMTRQRAESDLATLSIQVAAVDRDESVSFEYFTPMSPPCVTGRSASHEQLLVADDETVLLFGMIETGPRQISSERLVFDPQGPCDPLLFERPTFSTNKLAVVANAREVAALAPGATDLSTAASLVVRTSGAAAVIVKDGAHGCLVATAGKESLEWVGPNPTRSVWPLGSGDIFSAAFAHAWASGAEPLESARVASNAAAYWCATRHAQVSEAILQGLSVSECLSSASPELRVGQRRATVYLAAPFFTLSQRWLVDLCRNALIGLGADVFSPLHDVGFGDDSVACEDLDGLGRSDSVLALLDGWDPGSVYEVGWAHRLGLPVVGFVNDPRHEGAKMLVGEGAELHDDLSSALYRAVWAGQGAQVVAGRS